MDALGMVAKGEVVQVPSGDKTVLGHGSMCFFVVLSYECINIPLAGHGAVSACVIQMICAHTARSADTFGQCTLILVVATEAVVPFGVT